MRKLFLLADDDNDDTELFAEALAETHAGVDLHCCDDGYELFLFLAGAGARLPDIIFLDLNMPGISGWQCLARLKNDPKFKDIPVVMYSTSSNPRDRDIAMDLGAWGFITKPADYSVLVRLLDEIAHKETGALKGWLRNVNVL